MGLSAYRIRLCASALWGSWIPKAFLVGRVPPGRCSRSHFQSQRPARSQEMVFQAVASAELAVPGGVEIA